MPRPPSNEARLRITDCLLSSVRMLSKVAAFGFCLQGIEAAAQPPRQTFSQNGYACANCGISVERHLALRLPPEGPRAFPYVNIVRLRAGYYVAPVMDLAGILVFDPDGRFSHRIGRKGLGPGDFSAIGALMPGSGESLYVFDAHTRQVTVLGPNGEPGRRTAVPGNVLHAIPLSARSFVAHIVIPAPDKYGLPLHLLDQEGSLVRSFGLSDATIPLGADRALLRVVARSTDSTVWTARKDSGVVEEWAVSGKRLRRLSGGLATLANRYGIPRYLTADDILGPRTRALSQGRDGYLWVLMSVASSNSIASSPTVEGHQQKAEPDGHQYVNRKLATLIAVVRLRDGQLIASRVVPDEMEGFTSDGYAFSRDAGSADVIRLWRLSIRQGSSARRHR
jgi:6-bladed beta-propeller protein